MCGLRRCPGCAGTLRLAVHPRHASKAQHSKNPKVCVPQTLGAGPSPPHPARAAREPPPDSGGWLSVVMNVRASPLSRLDGTRLGEVCDMQAPSSGSNIRVCWVIAVVVAPRFLSARLRRAWARAAGRPAAVAGSEPCRRLSRRGRAPLKASQSHPAASQGGGVRHSWRIPVRPAGGEVWRSDGGPAGGRQNGTNAALRAVSA
jgi:hypothetical protein